MEQNDMEWNGKNEWILHPYQTLVVSGMAHWEIVQWEQVQRDVQGHKTIWEYANEHRLWSLEMDLRILSVVWDPIEIFVATSCEPNANLTVF